MMRLGLRLCLLLLATLTVTAAVQPAPPPPAGPPSFAIRAAVLTGQRAPGGGVFTEFSDPALNGRGSLVFAALTTGQQAHAAVYLRVNERISTLVASGQAAPTGGAFRVFNDVILSDRDTVVFLGRTTDRIAHQGLYLARNGTIVPVVTTGQPAPGGGAFSDFANPTINARDVVAFVGRMSQGGREGIFTSSEGSIIPVALSGQPAPTGGTFEFFVDGSPAQNDRGEIAFVAALAPRGTFGVFVLFGGRPIPVVTSDDEAPAGGAFTEFGSLMLTNPGTVGFVGRTARSPVREGLYVTGRAMLATLAQQGQAVAGEVLTSIATSAMNDEESVAFELGTPDPIPRAIFLATRAGVRIVVRAGDRAPSGRRFVAFGSPAINGRGQIAFVAETDDQQHGIYLATPR
jgi:hypothetical protein